VIRVRIVPPDFGVFGGANLEITESRDGVFSVTEYDGLKHKRTKHMTLNALIELLFRNHG
jgi:uncharacterized protein (UPF0303 family)